MSIEALFFLNYFATVFMTGLIWLVQIVHYPSFYFVKFEDFKIFHKFHSDRISFIVAPVMLVEILTAYLLVYYESNQIYHWYNLTSIICIFALTAFVSVPLHNKLEAGFDTKLVQKLILTNWYRTIVWSLRALVLSIYLINFILKN